MGRGTVVVTGSNGLVGSAAVRRFSEAGFSILGLDNDMRRYFFGDDASTKGNGQKLSEELENFTAQSLDVRDLTSLEKLFKDRGSDIVAVIHTAAQPSHDWAAREPQTDFSVNANGTLNLLELTRKFAPSAVFIFTSTNKVYGDTPNSLPLIELDSRIECAGEHPFAEYGVDETMSVDQSLHSLFGASKLAADILVQEYGRYFGLSTGVFRGGCLTGAAHAGAQLHGFLSYLVHCAVQGKRYTVFGYQGKQVRDNLHAGDLANMFFEFFLDPAPGEVFNVGGSRWSNCSILEAIEMVDDLLGRKTEVGLVEDARRGDHAWWVSDIRKFRTRYPNWDFSFSLHGIIEDLVTSEIARSGR